MAFTIAAPHRAGRGVVTIEETVLVTAEGAQLRAAPRKELLPIG